MRIAVFIPYYLPGFRGGGPIRTVAAMVEEHGGRHQFRILTPDTDWGEREPLPVPAGRWVPTGRAQVWYVRAGSARSLARGLAAIRAGRPDVVYLNGVMPLTWSILPLILARLRVFGRARLMIAPRGEFGDGALAPKATRKRWFFAAARLLRLYETVTWHASTELEAGEIRGVFPSARVLVRENEVLLPPRAVPPPVDPVDPADPAAPAPLRVVFLSRVSVKKGLHVLLAALETVDAATPIRLDVYGAGDADYIERCVAATDRLPAHVGVTFHGDVLPDRVGSAFAAADVFAFPTAHENFGHAVAEALAASCPVLLADVTPWTRVLAAGGGRVVPSLEPGDWAAALREWATATPRERRQRRLAAGRAYEQWHARRPRESVFELAFGRGPAPGP